MDGSLTISAPVHDEDAQKNDVTAPVALTGYPFLGLVPQIRRDPLGFFTRTAAAHGDVVELDLGVNKVLMLNHPDLIRHVSQDNYRNYHKSRFYRPLKPILGEGIFLAEGDSWVDQRRTAGKSFQGYDLKRMVSQMTAATADMLQRWKVHHARGEPVEVAGEMSRVTLDIVLRCLFSVELGDRQPEIFGALTTLLRAAERRVWSPLSAPRWLPTAENQACRHSLHTLDAFVHELIQRRLKDGGEHGDLLQILVDKYVLNGTKDTPPSLMRDQVLSMILAGHETSANALAWTWYLLAKNPEMGRRLGASVDETLRGRTPAFGDLASLSFAKMAFDEALRLYPPVWTISRTAQADDRIGGLPVPAGTNVMLCAYAVHRRPDYWTDPEGFDPMRFDPSRGGVQRYTYFPFGVGARSCLGERFGTMEALIILAMVSQVFRLSLAPGQRVEPEPMITLRPNGPIQMDLSHA